jgi:hypothetical protein
LRRREDSPRARRAGETRPSSARAGLRLRTYLTPSVPRSLFAYLARYLGDRLGVATELEIETQHSGPPRGMPDPFSAGELDVGFF